MISLKIKERWFSPKAKDSMNNPKHKIKRSTENPKGKLELKKDKKEKDKSTS
jgi:hypothetical protein